MTKKPIGVWIALGAVLLVVLWFIGSYNGFVSREERVKTAWAQVENQYQRRLDLVPNLVETVKGIAAQEQTVFQGVADARAKAGQITVTPGTLADPAAFSQFQTAQDSLGTALTRLLVTVENYPDLKSNENFLSLQDQLEGTENRIAVERQRYNETAQTYNIAAKRIPGLWIAQLFDFDHEKILFQAEAAAVTAPKVNF